jgi:hypothetical protein
MSKVKNTSEFLPAEQNIGRQETNSKEFSKVYIDKVSGSIKSMIGKRPRGFYPK